MFRCHLKFLILYRHNQDGVNLILKLPVNAKKSPYVCITIKYSKYKQKIQLPIRFIQININYTLI